MIGWSEVALPMTRTNSRRLIVDDCMGGRRWKSGLLLTVEVVVGN